jgi:hypothetical protein
MCAAGERAMLTACMLRSRESGRQQRGLKAGGLAAGFHDVTVCAFVDILAAMVAAATSG